MSGSRFRSSLACAAGLLAATVHVAAGARELPMFLVKPGEISVNGVLREWGSGFAALDHVHKGSSASRVKAALAYDERHLYVAATVTDAKFVRSPAFRASEDHLELVLAFPDDQGNYQRLYEVKLFAGEPGKLAGQVVAQGLGKVQQAEIVEAPAAGGYTVEAKIPWNLFPPAARYRVKMRGGLRYHDSDGTNQAVLATEPQGRAAEMPLLVPAAEQGLASGLIRQKGLSSPDLDMVADLAGDEMRERILRYDQYVVVLGPRFRGGEAYHWMDLGVVPKSGQLPLFEVVDLTGDGKAEVVIRKRIAKGDGWRELLQVLSFQTGDELKPVFEHETGISSPIGTVQNTVELLPQTAGRRIKIAVGSLRGYSQETYREPTETARPPLLLPWGEVASRTFGWNGSTFVKVTEEKQTAAASGASVSPTPSAPPPPRPPTADELLDQVFSLYKKEQGVSPKTPTTFDFVTNVVGDTQAERIVCHGRDLVVFGKGYREGRGYVSLRLPQFASDKDIVDVTARDMTGDGRAEILVRGLQRTKASEDLGSGELIREVFFVYSVSDTAIQRVFATETALELADKRVHGGLLLVTASQGLAIELLPGQAQGWDRKTWPYAQDEQPVSGIEPIRLPWSSKARYEFDGSTFARIP